VELSDAVRRRRMVRSFDSRPVDRFTIDALLGRTERAPSAGNTRGTAWIVLSRADETARYWATTTTPEWRASSPRWAGFSRAPVVLVSLASPSRYVDRYGESDKASSRLGPPPTGGGATAWTVPYWFTDAAFETMLVLLGAVEAGLGACFLGNFRDEEPLLSALGVPPGWRLFGSVLVGHPDGADHPSASLGRRPTRPPHIHYGTWSEEGKPRPSR
jgi:nitroreductase